MKNGTNKEFNERLDAALPIMLAEVIDLSASGETARAQAVADTLMESVSEALNPTNAA